MTTENGAKPMVSVLVITFNHGPYIEECLESLVAQCTGFPFEILVGEDCSSDDTREKVVRLAERYPEVIRPFLHEANKGARANSGHLRNQARGKYIALCEGDDFWHRTDKLRRQVEILEGDPGVSLVCTDADALFQSTGRRIRSVHERNGQWESAPADLTRALLTRRINIFTCSACMPRDLVLRMFQECTWELGPEQPMGDIQMWLECSRRGRIVPIRESMVTYRVLGESATHSGNAQRIFGFHLAALEVGEHYVRKFGYGEEVLAEVRSAQSFSLLDLVVRRNDGDLRRQLLPIMADRFLRGRNWIERLALWALFSDKRLERVSRWWPLALKSQAVPRRARSLLRRMMRGRSRSD